MTKIELELSELVRLIREQASPIYTVQETITETLPSRDFGLAIVIADRGHVWVGKVSLANGFATITGGAAIRNWGTTKGLGQLAKSGPTGNTVLDPVPTMHIREAAVISYIPCEVSAWNAKL